MQKETNNPEGEDQPYVENPVTQCIGADDAKNENDRNEIGTIDVNDLRDQPG